MRDQEEYRNYLPQKAKPKWNNPILFSLLLHLESQTCLKPWKKLSRDITILQSILFKGHVKWLHLILSLCDKVYEGLKKEETKRWRKWGGKKGGGARNKVRECEMSTETPHQKTRETKRRQNTAGHTQLRHGHHEWLKADFPFRQAYQSLHSVMEAKANRAWSSAFALSNHLRDVFKETKRGLEKEQWMRKGFILPLQSV